VTRPRLEVADVFRRHGPAWRAANEGHLSPAQRRVMSAVELCRTVVLGGHVKRCEDCAHTRVAYNSCRDRHCPKCQWAVKQALRRHLAAAAFRDPALALLDSLPVPACRFARAHRCRSFRGLAAFGYDALAHQTCYGFRLHLRVTWPRPTGPSRPGSSPASPAGRSATRATGARACAPSWPPPGST
jgi:hypothetical protein